MWLWERLQESYDVPIAVLLGLVCVWFYRRFSHGREHDDNSSREASKKTLTETFKEPSDKNYQSASDVTSKHAPDEEEDKVDCLVTPASLHRAVRMCQVEEVRALLTRDCDPSSLDRESNTSYHVLFQDITTIPVQDGAKVLELLLQTGNKINPSGVNILNREGKTPLHLAVRNTRPDLVHMLLKHGADRSILDSDGNTPLHTIIEYMQFSEVAAENEIFHLLLEEKDENYAATSRWINVLNDDGMSPLHQAVMYEETDNVLALLDKGADPNVANREGNTPLHTMLVTIDQNKPLSTQNKTLLTLLLKYKANVLAINMKGESALCLVTNPEIEEEFLNT